MALSAAANAALSAAVSGLAAAMACAMSLSAGGGNRPFVGPSLSTGSGATLIPTGGAAGRVGVAPLRSTGTRRTPVSGVPDGSLLWPRRMVTEPCWANRGWLTTRPASKMRGELRGFTLGIVGCDLGHHNGKLLTLQPQRAGRSVNLPQEEAEEAMFTGSLVALITPFRNGSVDEKGFEKFVAWQIKEGTDGLVPCGTTGESPTLSYEEHKRVIDICIQTAKGSGVPVIAGTGSNTTEDAIELTRHAKQS